MDMGNWLLVLFSAAFFLVVLFALVSFVVRLFRGSQPNRRHR